MLWLWTYQLYLWRNWVAMNWSSSSEGHKREERTTITQGTEKMECIGGSWSLSTSGRGQEIEPGWECSTNKKPESSCKSKLRGRRRELTTFLRKKGRLDLEKIVAEVEAVRNEGRNMFAALRALNVWPPNYSKPMNYSRRIRRSSTQAQIIDNCAIIPFECPFAPDGVGKLTQRHAILQHPTSAMEVQKPAANLRIDELVALI